MSVSRCLRMRQLPGVALFILLLAFGAAAPARASVDTFVPLAAIKPDSTDDPEISAVTPDGNTVVSEQTTRLAFTDITDPAHPRMTGRLDVGDAITDSVVVTPDGKWVLAGTGDGAIVVVDLAQRAVVRRIAVSDEVDGLAISPDGRYAAVADENESSDTQGALSVLDLHGDDPYRWTLHTVAFDPADPAFDPVETPNAQVQPEYVDINSDNLAAVTFQENNAIAIVDLAKAVADPEHATVRLFSAGVETHLTDMAPNDLLSLTDPFTSTRQPDAIAWTADNHHLVTADEGEDSQGGRGMAIYDDQGHLIHGDGDLGVDADAMRFGAFNQDRAPQWEGIDTGIYDHREYMFGVAERGYVMGVYDITDIQHPRAVTFQYTGREPEGVITVPSRDLVIVSDADRGAGLLIYKGVASGQVDPDRPVDIQAPAGMGWGEMAGLAAAGNSTLYAVAQDNAPAPGLTVPAGSQNAPQVYTLRTDSSGEALITARAALHDASGTVPNRVLRDVAADPTTQGGFWVASDRAFGSVTTPTSVLQVARDGLVKRELAIPGNLAPTGIAVSPDGGLVYVSTSTGKILRLDVAATTWATLTYNAPRGVGNSAYGLVDLASRPDGTLVGLEAFPNQSAPYEARIVRFSAANLANGATIADRTLLTTVTQPDDGFLYGPFTGIAVTPGGDVWTVNTGVKDPFTGDPLLRRVRGLLAGAPGDAPLGAGLPSSTPSGGGTGRGFESNAVELVKRFGDKLLVGGHFNVAAAQPAAGEAQLDPGTGAPAGALPAVAGGPVVDAQPDGAGGLYIAGGFTAVGGQPHRGVAHLRADGTLDPAFTADADGAVQSVALRGARLYLGGSFTHVGGQARNYVAAVDATTGAVDAGFVAQPNAAVNEVAVSANGVYIDGFLSSVGGTARNQLAKLDPATGGLDLTFVPPANDGGRFEALALDGNRVYVAGYMSQIGGSKQAIAALDAGSGALVPGFKPTEVTGGGVYEIVPTPTRVWAIGSMDTPRLDSDVSQPGAAIVALDPTTGATVPGFDAKANYGDTATQIAFKGDSIYLTGSFRTRDGVLRPTLQRLDAASGAIVRRFQAATDGSGGAIALLGDRLYAGGGFTVVGVARDGLSLYDARTHALDPDFETTFMRNGFTITDADVVGGKLYLTGQWDGIGDTRRYQGNFARLDLQTGEVDHSFNPRVAGLHGPPMALAHRGDRLYVGGDFYSIDQVARAGIAAIDTRTGEVDPGFHADTDQDVEAIAVDGDRLLIGGRFTHVSGVPRRRVAALDPTSGAVQAFDPSVGVATQVPVGTTPPPGVDGDQVVDAILRDGTALWIGGAFTTAGGQARANLVRVDAATGAVQSAAPNPDGAVLDLEPAGGGAIVAAGQFSAPRRGVFVLKSDGTVDSSWAPVVDGDVDAVAGAGSSLAIGGTFTSGLAFFDPVAPVNRTAPSIAGGDRPGTTATCQAGAWDNGPTGFSYTWARDGAAIAGATGATYAVADADAGTVLTCTVRASNDAGTSAPVTSAGVRVGIPPKITGVPTITGTPAAGGTLTCAAAPATGDGVVTTLAWTRNGSTVAGGATYHVGSGDAGARLACVQTSASALGSQTATSAPVDIATTQLAAAPELRAALPPASRAVVGAVRLTRSRAAVAVTVHCVGGRTDCRALLTLSAGSARTVTVAAGSARTVTVALSAAARRHLRRFHTLRVTAVAGPSTMRVTLRT